MKNCKTCNILLNDDNHYKYMLKCKKCHNKTRVQLESYHNKHKRSNKGMNSITKNQLFELYNSAINKTKSMEDLAKEYNLKYSTVTHYVRTQKLLENDPIRII